MGKVKVQKSDQSRILLTEVLPYEVPIIFSNQGFYDYVKEPGNTPSFIKDLLNNPLPRIPFNYKIKKDLVSHRTLSVMHPSSQKSFIDFYNRYDLLITHLCSRSPISLRYPNQVASLFYHKENVESDSTLEDKVEVEENEDAPENSKTSGYVCSYFKYRKYDLLYKFYDSYEFLRLERKYKHLLKFDISNCFSSIYTHSIAWAVKEKLFSKATINRKSFEKSFDILMQQSNHNETNGILIGPEISRIFAEIILQKIDLASIEALKECDIIFKQHYEVRRYVDDYFVFTNDPKHAKIIIKVFQEQLEKFKMYINPAKTEQFLPPFITKITIARVQLMNLVNDFFDKNFSSNLDEGGTDTDLKVISRPRGTRSVYSVSNKLILDCKCIIKEFDVNYDSVSRIILSSFKRKINRLYKKAKISELPKDQLDSLVDFIIVSLDLIFFFYSMDCCVRITYIVSQIIVVTKNFAKKLPEDKASIILKKISDESIFLMKNVRQEEKHLTIEVLNLLIALKSLGEDYLIEENLLLKLTCIETNPEKLNYFHFIVILYYIGNNDKYSITKSAIESLLLKIFTNETYFAEKAEITCLFLDILACPFFTQDYKNRVVISAYENVKSNQPSEHDRDFIRGYANKRYWFVDWSEDLNLEYLLSKKELVTPY
jgi:hypothetical protein